MKFHLLGHVCEELDECANVKILEAPTWEHIDSECHEQV